MLDKQDVSEIINEADGLILTMCERLGCTYTELYDFVANNPDIRYKFERAFDRILDEAENRLYTMVRNGDFKAVKFMLETRGRKRGYGVKNEKDEKDQIVVSLQLPENLDKYEL